MDTEPFRRSLRKSGKKDHVIDDLVHQVERFERYLSQESHKTLETAGTEDLQGFVANLEESQPAAANEILRGIALYYKFAGNALLASRASTLREQRVAKTRSSFLLRDFLGIDPLTVQKLAASSILNADQTLSAGSTPEKRAALARASGVAETDILELVKLSDLARLSGVKAVRARLYYASGVDTVEKLAACEPEELLALTAEFVQHTHFDGIAPLPKEVQSTIATARKLPKVVEF
jgi:hypothetical protein